MSQFENIEQIEKTFYIKYRDRVVIGKFEGEKFIFEIQDSIMKGKWIGSTSQVLKGLDDGSIVQLN